MKKNTGLRSNRDRGLERNLCRFFCTAAWAGRRDPRRALSYARVAARGVALQSAGVAPVAVADSQHLYEVIATAKRSPELLVMPVVQARMLDSGVLGALERCPNVVLLLRLNGLEDVVEEASSGPGRVTPGGGVAPAVADLRARRLLYGAAVDVTRSSFPSWTSRVFARSLFEGGFRAVLYVEHLDERSCPASEVLTASQSAAMPLTVDLLRAEFSGLFLRSTVEQVGRMFASVRDIQVPAVEHHEARLVA